MKQLTVNPLKNPIKTTILVPPDKSISHRAIIIGSIANGRTEIKNLLASEDCLNTLKIMQQLGVEINSYNNFETITIYGRGLRSLTEPKNILNCGNSGTTIRLLSGLLCGQSFMSVLTGDDSLITRPMGRVIEPLTLMGAKISGREHNTKAPIVITPGILHGISYEMHLSSAQVKSAIMLAGIQAKGETKIIEKEKSRDHTERMLSAFGAKIKLDKNEIIIGSEQSLQAQILHIPGDISSAAFFIAACAISPGSEMVLQKISVNPTRSGIITTLKKMGVKIESTNKKEVSGEPIADLFISSGDLTSTEIKGNTIPLLIDEIPILCIIMAQAKGKSVIKDAKELRFKESDRIKTMVQVLKKLSVEVNELEDGLEINGLAGEPFQINSSLEWPEHFDHRIAMSVAIAALKANEPVHIPGAEWISTSFPDFEKLINQIQMVVV
ncbi:MAG: 3-phosphoshikimate 1-carboxyvinyltransferase [Candidatus Melainabacteria bacterium RIFCSPLOWO2_02_FULL_35_15]|nr:MAG: 3-phosphoshikimate 1-carboxyvinyltransferase [Candidatus Melainabacteria bacterium RIFCSPLOWO2_12_FULL_35_11]OGI12981.1 MAG: 3-phosphoshikimate 1-carboxyvinyltransferase [Candidatus Melainabacteria bacterium RIFCSPLOWO2_02_FULL_35_15]